MSSDHLFRPLRLRDVVLKNRVMIAPMAMYSAKKGMVSDFHLVHVGRFALGGAGLVMMEATAVSRTGRISPGCTGLWSDAHVEGLKRIAGFVREYGAVPAIQLGHAGRKGSCQPAWRGGALLSPSDDLAAAGDGPWPVVSSMAEPFEPDGPRPTQLDTTGILRIVDEYAQATVRANAAGFDILEVHCAHGYLLHSFLSPLSNRRDDEWGGDLQRRMRFPLDVVRAVRGNWPSQKPLFVRISSVDGIGVGWSIEDSVEFCRQLKSVGVDVIDCSSGGMKMPRDARLVARTEGFHVPFASRIRREAQMPTVAVGLIRSPGFGSGLIERGDADIVAIAREALVDPNWTNRAASRSGANDGWDYWPVQFAMWLKAREATLQRATRDA